jgi:4-amino-4-deoxy-L-arabinose transferase-like glycosyltransferase
VLVTIGAAALRFIGLGTQSMWYDELSTTQVITGSVSGLLDRIRHSEGTPPLYFVLATVWSHAFGSGDAAIRSMSALAGTLTVPVAYLVTRAVGGGRRAGLLVAALVAVNPFLIWYSQEARAYALAVLLVTVALLFFVKAFQEPTTRNGLLFAVAGLLAVATHYFALVVIGPELVALVYVHRHEPRFLAAVLAPLAVGGALLVPLAALQRSTGLQDWISDWSLAFRLRSLARFFAIGPGAPEPWLWWLVVGATVVAVALALAFGPAPERSWARRLALLVVAGVGIPLVAVVLGNDYVLDRNLIVVLVPLIVVVGMGAAVRRTAWLGLACAAAIAATSIVTAVAVQRDRNLQRADWRAVAHAIDHRSGPRLVVFNTSAVLGSALMRYLPNARPVSLDAQVPTRTVDFVGLTKVPASGCDWWSGRSCSIVFLVDQPPPGTGKSLRWVATRRAGPFRVATYESSAPSVNVRDLVAPSDRNHAIVMLTER